MQYILHCRFTLVLYSQIIWTVDAGKGHTTPIEEYWPDNSYLNNGSIYSALNFSGDNSASIDFIPFQSGEQVVSSVKFKILWEDGTYDVGENGQIIYYDIYFDYNLEEGDPEIEIITPEENDQIMGDVEISCQGSADSVELWLDGNLIFTQNTDEFSYTWDPQEGLFGDLTLIAKAIYNNGRVSFSFVDFYLLYEIENAAVPSGNTDGVNLNDNDVVITLYAPDKEYVSITREEYNKIIRRSTLFACLILLLFALMGKLIFSFYGITVYAFKIDRILAGETSS